MPHRGATFAVSLLLLSLALAGAGCRSGGGKTGATATSTLRATVPAVTSTPIASAGTATPAPDIRREDLSALPQVVDFTASGGQVDTAGVTYADLTEDGVDDAVIPISSGGEGGDIAVFVFGYGPGGLRQLLRVIPESASLKDNIVDGKLTITEPVSAPNDPLCCPSELRVTTYAWNGEELVVESQRTEQTVQN